MLLPYIIETGDLVDAAPASRARDGPGIRCHGGLDGLVPQHAGNRGGLERVSRVTRLD